MTKISNKNPLSTPSPLGGEGWGEGWCGKSNIRLVIGIYLELGIW